MSDIYAVSLGGIHAAEQMMNGAARNIALGHSIARSDNTSVPPVQAQPFVGPVTNSGSSSPVDYATEIVTIIEARFGLDSNLKVTATQQQIDRHTLDLLG
ncbi:MAG TPA: hypothetical protein VE398_16160 [Acidobacteriota bacterium]|nr:hypothetical protein [Acidobacteriota bacterium]